MLTILGIAENQKAQCSKPGDHGHIQGNQKAQSLNEFSMRDHSGFPEGPKLRAGPETKKAHSGE
jgi:hypothetical protein